MNTIRCLSISIAGSVLDPLVLITILRTFSIRKTASNHRFFKDLLNSGSGYRVVS